MWFDAPKSNNQFWSWHEKILIFKTSSPIPKPIVEPISVVFSSFVSFEECSLEACCRFQHTFFRCPYLPQYQHLSFLFFPFDFDWEKSLWTYPLSLGLPLTTIASNVDISKLDFILVSLVNRAPTITSNLILYFELKLVEVTKWSHDSIKAHNNVISLSSDLNFTPILVN
jgi:hypothetical protein